MHISDWSSDVCSSDLASVHGLASSFIVCDELAQWKKRELFDVLRTSMGKRREPLMLAIGTQSPSPINIMSELVDYAGRVNSGEIVDPSFRSEEHTSELQSLMRISYAVFCLKKKNTTNRSSNR